MRALCYEMCYFLWATPNIARLEEGRRKENISRES
jgi:hypothetical protein